MAETDDSGLVLALIASGLVEAHGAIARGAPLGVPYPAPLQRGLDLLTLECLQTGEVPLAGVPELFRWCEEPLGSWRVPIGGPDVAGDVLLEAGEPTRACQEWAVDAHDVEAELFENEIVSGVRRRCRAAGREDSYVAFRQLVIEKPVLTDLELQESLMGPRLVPIAEQVKQCYPHAPIEFERGGSVDCCRDCGNLLLQTTEGLLCVDDRCPRRTAPKVGRTLPTAAGVRWLAAPVRMFVAAPGRAELRLRDALEDGVLKDAGVRVELWPNFDAYDLRITFKDGTVWAVDVKDWSNPVHLAGRLKSVPKDPPWDRSFIVPAREAVAARLGYLRTLQVRSKTVASECGFRVVSERRLLREVREKAGLTDA